MTEAARGPGRPKKDNPRQNPIRVRFTSDELAQIEAEAAVQGINLSEFIRRLALKVIPKSK